MKVKSIEEAVARYGPIQNGKWGGENQWMTMISTPSWFGIQVKNTANQKDADHIYMNKDMVEPFLIAIQNLVNAGVEHELKTFDGCWMIRSIRGLPGQTSWHSWGLAIDLNSSENPLGGPVRFSDTFIKCFTDAGFVAGAHFHRVDGMHFEWTDADLPKS